MEENMEQNDTKKGCLYAPFIILATLRKFTLWGSSLFLVSFIMGLICDSFYVFYYTFQITIIITLIVGIILFINHCKKNYKKYEPTGNTEQQRRQDSSQ